MQKVSLHLVPILKIVIGTECFCEYIFLGYCQNTLDPEIIVRCCKLCNHILVLGINIISFILL
jgi:hypothetical protein